VAVAQLVELRLVVPAVAGSNPVCHPFKPGQAQSGRNPRFCLAPRQSPWGFDVCGEALRLIVVAVAGSNPVIHP
jgi:hypothetical protein